MPSSANRSMTTSQLSEFQDAITDRLAEQLEAAFNFSSESSSVQRSMLSLFSPAPTAQAAPNQQSSVGAGMRRQEKGWKSVSRGRLEGGEGRHSADGVLAEAEEGEEIDLCPCSSRVELFLHRKDIGSTPIEGFSLLIGEKKAVEKEDEVVANKTRQGYFINIDTSRYHDMVIFDKESRPLALLKLVMTLWGHIGVSFSFRKAIYHWSAEFESWFDVIMVSDFHYMDDWRVRPPRKKITRPLEGTIITVFKAVGFALQKQKSKRGQQTYGLGALSGSTVTKPRFEAVKDHLIKTEGDRSWMQFRTNQQIAEGVVVHSWWKMPETPSAAWMLWSQQQEEVNIAAAGWQSQMAETVEQYVAWWLRQQIMASPSSTKPVAKQESYFRIHGWSQQ